MKESIRLNSKKDARLNRLPNYKSETCTLDEAISELRRELENGADMIWIVDQIEDLAVNPKYGEWTDDGAFDDVFNAASAYLDAEYQGVEVVDSGWSQSEAAEVIKKYLTR